MNEKNQALNLKILLSFIDAYQYLEEEEILGKEEMRGMLDILDSLERIPPQELLQLLENHFPSLYETESFDMVEHL